MILVLPLSPAQLRLYRVALDKLLRAEKSRLARLQKVRSKRAHACEARLAEIRAEFQRLAILELETT